MEVYLDNAATTKPLKSVVEALVEAMEFNYGNPSSLHRKGLEVERKIKEVRKYLSKEIKGKPSEVIFTSGGTESNNIAILGALNHVKREAPKVITLPTEHKSVLNAIKELEGKGFEVCHGKMDDRGRVDLSHLQGILDKNTVLVSISYINNETGVIQPIEEIGKILKDRNCGAKFHVDGVQAFGKVNIDVKKCNIDMLTGSAHKIHGPKGIGFLYVKEGTLIKPLFFGGTQEYTLRPGTENTPGILGFGNGLKELLGNKREVYNKVLGIKKAFMQQLEQEISDISIVSKNIEEESPYILNVSFLGVKSEVLLHSLESVGIYVSSGSACTSKEQDHSHVLEAIGLSEESIDSALRFSFSRYTTEEEINYALGQLKSIVNELRMIMKR
ncbi:cysteine desulfurase family protein [Isachenkonia alkalipeptolytica]|uniref:cysteine desulfurase n=1 Tax=Isachenkonia alkalipeptolytica TaxID=2565777 RepID=A0AA44BFZ5_9CLOT|nr:cysteine desulfurase family protein [Isachenkonia alkalipeptolytica]NBG88976.1 cysteine desulfurase [Isachenkonia alkalipeptolytica]